MRSGLAVVAAGVMLFVLAPVAVADGPALSVSEGTLAAALDCPSEFTHTDEDPVLLVHGTGIDADLSWSWNYEQALPDAGFDVCTVDLPEYALGDMQVASEYVVFAVREMHEATERDVDLIGHSQGSYELRWAVKWWPDVLDAVDDLISLSTPHHGLITANVLCAVVLVRCDAAEWQFRIGSDFLGALNAGDETPDDVDHTNLMSATDELVVYSDWELDGATNYVIQSKCLVPRVVTHIGMLADAVVYALVLDALDNAGPADPSRVSSSVCANLFMPGVTALSFTTNAAALGAAFSANGQNHANVGAEPALKDYAD